MAGMRAFTFLLPLVFLPPAEAQEEPENWYEIRKQSAIKCANNLGLSVDLLGYGTNTLNLSLMCKSRHNNWHILQYTDSKDVELKRESELSGTSIGYIYRDYFWGLNDGRRHYKNNRGFMVLGGGYGDYVKKQRKTGEKISIDGLFVTFGGGSEFRREDSNFALSWSLAIAAGGVVTDRYFTVSIIYFFPD